MYDTQWNHADEVNDCNQDWGNAPTSLLKDLTEGRQPTPNNRKSLSLHSKQDQPSTITPRIESNLLSRDEVGELLANPTCELGIDYIAATFQVSDVYEETLDVWRKVQQGKNIWDKLYLAEIPLMKGTVYVRITGEWYGLRGFIQFNPSTVLFGAKSLQTASLEQAHEVFHSVMDELESYVRVVTPREETKLSRVDVSVTVGSVINIDGIVLEASHYPYNSRLKTATYKSIKRVESVSCKTKRRGGFVVYNKSIQAGLPGAILRCETQAMRKHLKKHCPTIQHLTHPRCREMFEYFLGNFINGLKQIPRTDVDNVLADSKDTQTLVHLIGLSVLADKGYHVPISDYFRNKKLKPFQKKYQFEKVGDLLGSWW